MRTGHIKKSSAPQEGETLLAGFVFGKAFLMLG
jgi:hypothetical protein